MGQLTNKIEMRDHLQITIVILIILVISIWTPYSIVAKEYIHIMTTKASRLLTFVRDVDMFLRYNLQLHNESTFKLKPTIYGIPTALAASTSAEIPSGIVNQYNASSSQPGLAVGTYPVGVAVNPVTKRIYATNEFSNTVSVISGTSSSIEGTITVGNFPYGVAVNPFDSRVYVTNRGSNTVSVIDGSTNTKLHNITVQNSPVGIAVDPSANWIYVTNINSNTVSVIDGVTDKVTANITVGKFPYGIAANPITKKVYVTNIDSDTISVIDGLKNKVTASINVGKNPVGIAVNPITSKVYVTNIQANTVSVINGTSHEVTSTINVNPSLGGSYRIHDPVLSMPIVAKFPLIASLVGVDDVTNMIYVTNTGSDTVSIIDGNSDSVVVKVGFNVTPPNSGDIQCNGQHILPNTYFLYRNGTNLICNANAGQGYKFSSWSNIASGSSNSINLKVSQYGDTLIANFDQTLSPEQYLAIIIGPISIISIIVGWLFRSRQRRYLNKYMTLIDVAYETLQERDNGRECLLRLQLIRKEVTHLFKKGKISDSYYNILQNKISEYIVKVHS
jgi:YVTN family beta-propeller protein